MTDSIEGVVPAGAASLARPLGGPTSSAVTFLANIQGHKSRSLRGPRGGPRVATASFAPHPNWAPKAPGPPLPSRPASHSQPTLPPGYRRLQTWAWKCEASRRTQTAGCLSQEEGSRPPGWGMAATKEGVRWGRQIG